MALRDLLFLPNDEVDHLAYYSKENMTVAMQVPSRLACGLFLSYLVEYPAPIERENVETRE